MIHSISSKAESRPIRLLAVAHRSEVGGTEVCFERVIAALASDPDYEVCAAYPSGGELARRWSGLATHLEYDAGVLPDKFDVRAYRGWLRRSFGAASRVFETELADWEPDVIVSFTSVLTAPMDVAARLQVPGITYVREFVQPSVVRRWLWRRLAKNAARLIAVSSEVAAGLERFAPSRVRLVHDGVPLPATMHDTHWPPMLPRIAFYGGYDHRKGGELFVRMARIVLETETAARFFYYGVPTPEQAKQADFVRELAGDIGVLHAFEFVETREFFSTFGWNSVVVMPSEREGLGLVAIDAMSFGVPVVASRTGGLLDVIEDGRTGLLATPGDVEEFAAAVLGIVSDPRSVMLMGAAGRRRVEQYFSLERAVDGLKAVIGEVIGESHER